MLPYCIKTKVFELMLWKQTRQFLMFSQKRMLKYLHKTSMSLAPGNTKANLFRVARAEKLSSFMSSWDNSDTQETTGGRFFLTVPISNLAYFFRFTGSKRFSLYPTTDLGLAFRNLTHSVWVIGLYLLKFWQWSFWYLPLCFCGLSIFFWVSISSLVVGKPHTPLCPEGCSYEMMAEGLKRKFAKLFYHDDKYGFKSHSSLP